MVECIFSLFEIIGVYVWNKSYLQIIMKLFFFVDYVRCMSDKAITTMGQYKAAIPFVNG